MNKSQARARAVELVSAALQSKSIELSGPRGAATAESAATNDAKYLEVLLNKLTSTLLQEPS